MIDQAVNGGFSFQEQLDGTTTKEQNLKVRKTLEDGTVEDINQRTVGGEAAAVAYMQTR